MSIEDRLNLPTPGWDPITEEHWLAAGQGRLAIQRCSSCGHHRWPPSWACHNCHSTDWTWDDLPGTGTLYTFTWADYRPEDHDLYCIGIIELDGTEGEPVRLASRIVDPTREDLRCGLSVEVVFQPVDDDVAIPFFRLVTGG